MERTFSVIKKKKGNIITRDDVVSQRLKFGSAFLSSSWESKIASFLTFPYPEPVPKKLYDFYWLQLRIACKSGWIAQAEKDTASEKGKVRLQFRGGRRLKVVL